MRTLQLHNSWSQELFVHVTQALQNVVVSGTSLRIKYRLVQHRKSSFFPVTYSDSLPHINIANRTLARQSFLCVWVCVCGPFYPSSLICLVLRIFPVSASSPPSLLPTTATPTTPKINPHFKRLLW